jgi:hypothetical protein
VAETTVKAVLCCGFQGKGKAMGQVYQCSWRIYREIKFFPASIITCFTSYCDLFTDSSSYFGTQN